MLLYHCDSVFLLCRVIESSLFSPGCCKSVTLSATGVAAEKWPTYLGRYVATEEFRPVFRNSNDVYLYRDSDGTWRASKMIGGRGHFESVDTAECPASNSQWQYWAGVGWDWHSGDITVKCAQIGIAIGV